MECPWAQGSRFKWFDCEGKEGGEMSHDCGVWGQEGFVVLFCFKDEKGLEKQKRKQRNARHSIW